MVLGLFLALLVSFGINMLTVKAWANLSKASRGETFKLNGEDASVKMLNTKNIVVEQLIKSLESDAGWVFIQRSGEAAEFWKNNYSNIKFTMVHTDLGGPFIFSPFYHHFSTSDIIDINEALMLLKTRMLIGKRSLGLDKELAEIR